MKGPKNRRAGVEKAVHDAGLGRAAPKQLNVRDYFTEPRAEEVVRKIEAWTLLQWYHHRYVLPNLGLRGFFRRLWARIYSHKVDGHRIELIALTSPWDEIRVKRAIHAALEELERCPMAFIESGSDESRRCELDRDHEGNHKAGSFEWSDDPLPMVDLEGGADA